MKVIMPIASLRLNCPKCGSKTVYKRKGYDGELGEGQYCIKCEKFIEAMINRSFPMFVSVEENQVSVLHDKIQKEVNDLFQRKFLEVGKKHVK